MLDDGEYVYRYYCTSCGRSSLVTELQNSLSLFDLDKAKCICGNRLLHHREWHDKKMG